jgi:hypothetical protein
VILTGEQHQAVDFRGVLRGNPDPFRASKTRLAPGIHMADAPVSFTSLAPLSRKYPPTQNSLQGPKVYEHLKDVGAVPAGPITNFRPLFLPPRQQIIPALYQLHPRPCYAGYRGVQIAAAPRLLGPSRLFKGTGFVFSKQQVERHARQLVPSPVTAPRPHSACQSSPPNMTKL